MNPVCYLMPSAVPAQRICLCFKPTCWPCFGAISVAACLPVSRPPARVRASRRTSAASGSPGAAPCPARSAHTDRVRMYARILVGRYDAVVPIEADQVFSQLLRAIA